MSLFSFLGFEEIEFLGVEETTMFSSEEIQKKKRSMCNDIKI